MCVRIFLKFSSPLSSEWFPKSFQSKLAKERNLVGIRCSSSVEMMARNQIAPFHFSRSGVFYVLALRYGRLDDYLAQINQLRRAATLPPVEQNAMIATICYSIQNRLAFDSCWLESVKETILLKVFFMSNLQGFLFLGLYK